jgi:hypothetical protein
MERMGEKSGGKVIRKRVRESRKMTGKNRIEMRWFVLIQKKPARHPRGWENPIARRSHRRKIVARCRENFALCARRCC